MDIRDKDKEISFDILSKSVCDTLTPISNYLIPPFGGQMRSGTQAIAKWHILLIT